LRERWGVGADAEVVLGVGRFVRKKGFEYLIDAVARLASQREGLRLVLAGDGDLRDEFTARIADRGLGARVILPGVLHQDEVAASLAAADVVVVPSVRDPSGNVDGLPNVVLEALASGTPLVATPAGGIASVVQDGQTGLLVPEADPAALATAIGRLLDGPTEATALATAARLWAEQEGSWSHAIDGFERAYEIACRPANSRD
jgi:glycosyltransferase involved in cell wall biosynthesis